ncbi:hypothetical protein VW29_18205 [Devosia limi DSM 17137]|uniref:Uncharacterized protein n=1 Tax=Devosia limi DSM 17137 TaxID=1121477 RepID=A0A0F5L4G0_9HYPH|nr:hypothetical protein [Devosia limi]KKB77301.1 hypothetical protein VW29_18205 [Devosia limi DSM 17137]SHE65320.1 hypothetical protein SAMN02745223_00797 [Devosia limi DSM 17137]
MGSVTRGAIITLAFAAALIVPALAGLSRAPNSPGQDRSGCWELVNQANAGTMFEICSSSRHW